MQIYSPEAKFLMESSKEMAKIRELWYDALSDAVDNFNGRISDAKLAESETVTENAENKKTSAEEGEGRYSKRYKAAYVNKDLLLLIDKTKKNLSKPDDLVNLGVVPDWIAKEIYNCIGVDPSGFKIVIHSRQIKHILKDHGTDGNTDNSMADDNDIAKMQYAINNPDSIIESGRTKAYSYMLHGYNRTSKTVLLEKVIGSQSYYVVEAVADTKAKTIYIVTAFIGPSGYKKGISQTTNAKSPGVTSKIGTATIPNNNLSPNKQIVKPNPPNSSEKTSTDTDKRSSKRIKTEESARSIIAGALESVATTDKERGILSRYKEKLGEMEAKATELKLKRGELHELVYTKGKRTAEATARIASLSEEIKKLEASVRAFDERLLRMESTQFLRELVMSHRKQGWAEASHKYREKIHQGVENRGRKAGHLFCQRWL